MVKFPGLKKHKKHKAPSKGTSHHIANVPKSWKKKSVIDYAPFHSHSMGICRDGHGKFTPKNKCRAGAWPWGKWP